MTVQNIKLSPEETQKVAQIEGSIQHWAIEYAQLNLKVRDLEGVLHSLYAARKQSLDAICKNSKIDIESIAQAILTQQPNGNIVLTVHMQDKSTPPNSGPTPEPGATLVPKGDEPTSAS
jgi:hypothetical protein